MSNTVSRRTTGIKTKHMWSLSGLRRIFSLTDNKKKFSLYFDCCVRLSEVYLLQQYPIVCVQEEHRNRFWAKPRPHSQRSSHGQQSGVSQADNLRVQKTRAAHVSNNSFWFQRGEKEDVESACRSQRRMHLNPAAAFNVVKRCYGWKIHLFFVPVYFSLLVFVYNIQINHWYRFPLSWFCSWWIICDINIWILVTIVIVRHDFVSFLWLLQFLRAFKFSTIYTHDNKNPVAKSSVPGLLPWWLDLIWTFSF